VAEDTLAECEESLIRRPLFTATGTTSRYPEAFRRDQNTRGPDRGAQTYGGGGGYPFDPSLHQNGAIGCFFLVGANYKF